MIVGVAIRSDTVLVVLPKPNRHHDCFRHLKGMGINAVKSRIGVKKHDQGFYTHTGKYLNREQAFKHLKRIKQSVVGKPKHVLFSEYLW